MNCVIFRCSFVTFLKDPQGNRALLKLLTPSLSKHQDDVKGQLFFLSSLKVMSLLRSHGGSVLIQSSQGNFWVERIYRHDTLFTNNALISISVSSMDVQVSECFRGHEDTDQIKTIVMWILLPHLAIG